MKEFVEKLIDGLREQSAYSCGQCMDEAIEVVCKIAEEYINTSTDISTNTSTTNAEAYNKGLICAKEILHKVYNMTCDEMQKIFGVSGGFYSVINMFSMQDIIAKLEAYEKEKELKVGDVVESNVDGKKYLILAEANDGEWDFVALDIEQLKVTRIVGSNYYFKKTNKHIDIASVLEQLKGEER